MRSKFVFLTLLSVLVLLSVPTGARADQVADKVAVPSPPATASALQLEETADLLRARKEYNQAITYYQAALKQDPNNAVLFNKCGIAQLQLNDTGAAIKNFKKAMKLHPSYAEALNNLGAAYYMEKNYKKAIHEYNKAIALRNYVATFHANLGTAWFARRKMDIAMQHYMRALQLDPEVMLRTSQVGIAAHVSSPEDRAQLNYVLAKLYARQGDIERSIQCLRRAKDFGYSHMNDIYKDPEFAFARTDPRFGGFMEEVGK
jgi:tetratricopeptide (TPR) repeat protein